MKILTALLFVAHVEATVSAFPAIAETQRLQCPRDEAKYSLPRQALVIGNARYEAGWDDLGDAPRNDADDMASRLCRLGFEVTVGKDLNADTLRRTLDEFAATAAEKVSVRPPSPSMAADVR